MSDEPVWWRYRNEPDALMGIISLHYDQIQRDPANAQWYREDIAQIDAYLRRIK